MRYDLVTVLGSVIATTAPAVLSSPGITLGNQFMLTVTGSAGSNYVIQISTNLSASNWVSIFTNAAPFTFTDSDAANFPQGFYRALLCRSILFSSFAVSAPQTSYKITQTRDD